MNTFFVVMWFWTGRRAPLPHDPGHQHHGGFVEGVEELDEDLPLLTQLSQSHAEHDGKHHQAQDVHPILVVSKRDLGRGREGGRQREGGRDKVRTAHIHTREIG